MASEHRTAPPRRRLPARRLLPGLRPAWRIAAALLLTAALAPAPAAHAQESSPAAAEPSEAEKAKARALMDEGDDRLEAKDYAGALKAYEAADAIMHLPMTGEAVAQAQAALGLLLEAREKAIAVRGIPRRPDENAAYARARESAAALAADLARRIPSILITIEGGAEDVEVAVDGVLVPKNLLNVPYNVNPGRHVVTARAPEHDGAKVELMLTEGQRLPATLTLRATALPVPPPPVVPDRPAPSGTSPLVYAGFGVGAAGIIAGSVTGILSLSRTSDLEGPCANKVCPSTEHDTLAAANTLANVSNVAFAVGAVGVGVGVVGLVISGGDKPPPATGRVRVRPAVGPGSVMILGVF